MKEKGLKVTADMEKIQKAVASGRAKKIGGLVEGALEEGKTAKEILDAMIESMSIIGEKFKNNEVFVPEVLMSARAMQAGVDVLRPYLIQEDVQAIGKIVIGTVAGDAHDIGKNLVGMMMEGAGFDVIDLGVDVSADAFMEALKKNDAHILGMSALLTTTMPEMRKNIEALKEAGMRHDIKVMIGGAPVTAEYAEQIGADGYSADAASAVDLAKSFLV